MLLPAELKNQDRTGPSTADRIYSWFKRGLDITLSSIGLLVLAPVFALLAIVIKLDSRGPVFYGQERIGLNRRRSHGNHRAADERRRKDTFGRPFKIYKLRTMVADAEKNTGPIWAKAGDSRVTRVGKILRKTRLDEFPQLWNVLRGEMSLVGPRPERPSFVLSLSESLPDYPKRCFAVPGITGLAQVKSRYDTSIETVSRKLQYDLYYVRHGRLMLDFKIMVATLKVMARGEGAH
jgi:lipopolysaccharide/colanic/teichoic acid biosynthesis glycosyltransferase